MRLGFKLIAEAYSPTEIVAQAVRAEEAGFDFVEVSDHFHPWVSEHEHSGFAFSMLAAAAARTERIELATGAGCDHLALINAGPDMDGFFDFFRKELGPALRGL